MSLSHPRPAVRKVSDGCRGHTAGIERLLKRRVYDTELPVFLPNSVQASTLPSRNIVGIWNDN